MGTAPLRPFGVAVPVRAFRLGNTRLTAGIDDATRTTLARRLAERVVAAAADAPVVVVSSAPEVVEWAEQLGLTSVPDPGTLDAAARAGTEVLAGLGCRRVVVAHADLPFVTDYDLVAVDADVPTACLVPCHHDDGTPVLSLPAGTDFAFAYGPGSFRRHVDAAHAAGLAVRVVRDPKLGFDVDTIDDLAVLERRDPTLLGARAGTDVPRP